MKDQIVLNLNYPRHQNMNRKMNICFVSGYYLSIYLFLSILWPLIWLVVSSIADQCLRKIEHQQSICLVCFMQFFLIINQKPYVFTGNSNVIFNIIGIMSKYSDLRLCTFCYCSWSTNVHMHYIRCCFDLRTAGGYVAIAVYMWMEIMMIKYYRKSGKEIYSFFFFFFLAIFAFRFSIFRCDFGKLCGSFRRL